MSSVVHYCQCLFSGVTIFVDLTFEPSKNLFDGRNTEVLLQKNVDVFLETVLLDVLTKDLYVIQDFWEVGKPLLDWVSVFVCSRKADGRVVVVAKDEALSSVWGEVGQARSLQFAELVVCHGWVRDLSGF